MKELTVSPKFVSGPSAIRGGDCFVHLRGIGRENTTKELGRRHLKKGQIDPTVGRLESESLTTRVAKKQN